VLIKSGASPQLINGSAGRAVPGGVQIFQPPQKAPALLQRFGIHAWEGAVRNELNEPPAGEGGPRR